MQKLKVGFVGAGFISSFHARAMESVREMELAALLQRSGAERLQVFARESGLGPAEIFPSIAELAKRVDVIALYSPNESRLAAMEEIVHARRSGASVMGVICDKPLGRTLAEARRMEALAREAGLRTAYFENQIHMKAIRGALQQLVPQVESMGPLLLTRSAEEHSGPHMSWFWDPRRQGGGVLSDMGCHSIAVGWYALTPPGKPLTFLEPETVTCDIALLKWGLPAYRERLLRERGVDYAKTPAEDFATGMVTFRNPTTGQIAKAQFTDSWMFDKQGLRLFMEGLGPGYAFEINTLLSPLSLFVGDDAAQAISDREEALEKSSASRGLLSVPPNEPDLYGYVDENRDAARAFLAGRDGLLPFSYGVEITRLVMAAYLSAERKASVSLKDPATTRELETFVPLVAQGRGSEMLR